MKLNHAEEKIDPSTPTSPLYAQLCNKQECVKREKMQYFEILISCEIKFLSKGRGRSEGTDLEQNVFTTSIFFSTFQPSILRRMVQVDLIYADS